VTPTADLWGQPVLKLTEAQEVTVLESWEQIRDASATAIPLVTQTEIADAGTGLRAIIECPTKTMNISLEKATLSGGHGAGGVSRSHDATGPRDRMPQPGICGLQRAGVRGFRGRTAHPDFRDAGQDCQVYHYTKPFSLPARNRVLALGKL